MRRNLRRDFILPTNSYIHLVASGCNARCWCHLGWDPFRNAGHSREKPALSFSRE
jgi:hypothetical protein